MPYRFFDGWLGLDEQADYVDGLESRPTEESLALGDLILAFFKERPNRDPSISTDVFIRETFKRLLTRSPQDAPDPLESACIKAMGEADCWDTCQAYLYICRAYEKGTVDELFVEWEHRYVQEQLKKPPDLRYLDRPSFLFGDRAGRT